MTTRLRVDHWRILLPLCLVLLSGCVYRIPIQQGNFLEVKDLDQINVGMTRSQVRYLLGTPMVADPFNNARWDYIYFLKRGRIGEPKRRHFIVFFDDDKVERMERHGEFSTPADKNRPNADRAAARFAPRGAGAPLSDR